MRPQSQMGEGEYHVRLVKKSSGAVPVGHGGGLSLMRPVTRTHKEGFSEPRDEEAKAEYTERRSTAEDHKRDRLDGQTAQTHLHVLSIFQRFLKLCSRR